VAGKSHRCVWESSLIDTAEMHGDGEAEQVITEVILGQHQGTRVVTEVYPHNSSWQELPKACKSTRKRLYIGAIARSQIPKPDSTAEYSVTNAVSCG
jgi:diketogulonate reductase-like aldo/keto reductase